MHPVQWARGSVVNQGVSAEEREEEQERARLLRLLRVLTPHQVVEIDRALDAVGPFGEVRLVKVKGKLRFIQRLESREVLCEGKFYRKE